MKLFRSKKFKIPAFILILCCLGYFLGTSYLTQKLDELLHNKLPKQIEISYQDLSLSLINGGLTVEDLNAIVKDSTLQNIKSDFHIEKVTIRGFNYFEFYKEKAIQIDKFVVVNPKGIYQKVQLVSEADTIQNKKPLNINNIEIDHFEIRNAQFTQLHSATDSLNTKVQKASISLHNVALKKDSLGYQYELGKFEFDMDSLYYRISNYDHLRIGKIKGDQGTTQVADISLYTYPNAKELSHLLSIERDHFQLNIDSVNVYEVSLFDTQSPYDFRSKRIDFKNLEFSVYRDKLIHDDVSIKPMTSEMLRKIPIPFMVDSLSFGHNKILYQERVKPHNQGGILFFDEGHLAISNLSNHPPENTQTILYIDTKFMGKSPVKATWIFSANDLKDQFRFTGSSTNIQLSDINAFSAPNLNATMNGEIYSLYYDFYGDAYQSEATVKANFNNVEIVVLDKNNRRRNKFYSSLANMIVKNSSKTKKSIYEEAQVTVKRDRTKSQFNYIYLNLKESLMKVFL